MQQKTGKTIPHNNNLKKTYTPPEIKKLDQITKMTLGPNSAPGTDNKGLAKNSEVS